MTEAAQQYGQALYELARDEGISRLVFTQMQSLAEAFRQQPAFLQLLATPNLNKQERCSLLEDSFREMLHPYLLNFLKLLTREGSIRKFSNCSKHFASCYYADNGILPAQAYTAQPLTPEQSRQLTEKLESITGKTVLLENRVDPQYLGGVRICYDGKQVDGTIKNRLLAVGKLLKNTVL